MVRKRGASDIAEDDVLLDVERDIVKVDGLSAHFQSRESKQEDDNECKILKCVDGGVWLKIGDPVKHPKRKYAPV